MFSDQPIQWTGIAIESFHSYCYRKIQLVPVMINPAEELLETDICVRDVKLFLGDVVTPYPHTTSSEGLNLYDLRYLHDVPYNQHQYRHESGGLSL